MRGSRRGSGPDRRGGWNVRLQILVHRQPLRRDIGVGVAQVQQDGDGILGQGVARHGEEAEVREVHPRVFKDVESVSVADGLWGPSVVPPRGRESRRSPDGPRGHRFDGVGVYGWRRRGLKPPEAGRLESSYRREGIRGGVPFYDGKDSGAG